MGNGERDPLWYKDAILYEVHVRAFYDSDGDGRGDFQGLTAKLDYLRDLGVTAIWLLPFYPSPWRDDGYDISDYTSVHPAYGSLEDLKVFLDEAHARGLKVVTELVINHTSDQHPWFQRARLAPPGSPERDFYVWSDTDTKYAGTRIIFTDTETSNWTRDPVAGAYYWHRFFSHQPDLNFDNPRVQEEIFKALDFWMEMGVDGLRLDAIPYLYEREGTNNENLPETHAFLKKLRAHVDTRFQGRMLLGEANQWPEDSIAYFGDPATGGDECHMAFHFPVMPRLFMALRMEDRYPIIEILQQTPPIPEKAQWAIFLRNHDELTLEMVTDEERDYMYRVYAADRDQRINVGIRRRLAPLLGNDRRRIELLNGLLFSLPGTPVLYYGDEIGMGDNFYLGDRNGVRTPMQWSADKNAGFSRANPQRLYLPVIVDPQFHYEAVNVETQQANPHSLLWWTRRLIALRKRHPAFSRGTIELLQPENHRVLAFLRRHGDETLLVVANLSRFAQHAELPLAAFSGLTPVELFGRSAFPKIGAAGWGLTLSPHSFLWFSLVSEPSQLGRARQEAPSATEAEARVPVLAVEGPWTSVLAGREWRELEAALLEVLPSRRWFGGRTPAGLEILEVVPLAADAVLTVLRADYADAEAEIYALPLAFAPDVDAGPAECLAVARLVSGTPAGTGLLYDPMWDPAFDRALLAAVERGECFHGRRGELVATASPAFTELRGEGHLEPSPWRTEASNTSVRFGDRLILKLFRRLEPGVNPDLEISRFLTEETGFRHVPRVAGWLELRDRRSVPRSEPVMLAMLQEFISNEGDAWSFTQDALGRYFLRVLTGWGDGERGEAQVPAGSLVELAERTPGPEVFDRVGTYLPTVRLLGERTAELHVALASGRGKDFAPEPFSELYQRSVYDSMRTLTKKNLRLLGQRLSALPEAERGAAEALLGCEERIVDLFKRLLSRKVAAERIRTHGDYHLGRILYTGRDFYLLDFEGEPSRSLSERRLKRSPLRDVAGMLRSFQYAAYVKLFEEASAGVASAELVPELERWALYWQRWVSAAFLRAYLDRARGASFLPSAAEAPEDIALLLDAFVLERAIHELGYELNHRPTWVRIPLLGLHQILGAD
ncbi:MAG: maltose alpha-D-glucosyltransferase / alpha-amylase [Acidobacteriota bacterium]|jgi:maltose alpha-D-glucosyltransferase/alpha-amylase|nr:maltose alpha-D-glucosyltransferase / alpha-amylase [Acidobacteriota bacterium]